VPLYESVYIARPDISATQVETLTAVMTKILEENGGKVTKDEYWGLKSLAYRIKKNRKGHYSLLNINCPAAALTEMERNMRLHEDVLRYMSVRVDEHEEEPSVMMQSKSSRDDRDRDRDRGRDRPKTETAAPAAAAATAASEATAAAPEAVEAHAAAAAEAPAASEESAPAADDKDTKE
jgi:small subunit ribosomal protein S6